MRILLVIAFLIPFTVVGFIISKLDKLLGEGIFVKDDDKIFPIAIVLGETEQAKQIIELLEGDRIQVLHLTEPFLFKKERGFSCLFALSENDVDNIILCKIAKKIYGIEAIISICNDYEDEAMFVREKIKYLPCRNLSANTLYNTIMQGLEMKS